MTFEEFRDANISRCNQVFHGLNEWSIFDWAIALIGEAGEAMNNIKKLKRMESVDKPTTQAEYDLMKNLIAEEIADVVTYADLLLASQGYSLEEELKKKFNKVSDKRGSDIKL